MVIAGRRRQALEEVVAANPGMAFQLLDVPDANNIKSLAKTIIGKYPALNVLVNMAGFMKVEHLVDSADSNLVDETIATNLAPPIQLTLALLPHLKLQPKATVITVTLGLALMPMALTPTYSATKAAIHSWSVTLRHQLRETSVEVLELTPPYVQTELMGRQQVTDPHAMPLADFITETMDLLPAEPPHGEVLVKGVYPYALPATSTLLSSRPSLTNSMPPTAN